MRCRNEIYFVIDNYQLFASRIKRQIINTFSIHGSDRLHMIFIMQPFEEKSEDEAYHTNIYQIDQKALLFDKEGIRLQMLNYQQCGMIEHTSDVESEL